MRSTLAFAPTEDDLDEGFFDAPIVRFDAPRPASEAADTFPLDSQHPARETARTESERTATP